MNMPMRSGSRQQGVVVLEFTLAVLVFVFVLIGFVLISRMLLAWMGAQEATRLAARSASMCSIHPQQEQKIRTDMGYLLIESGLVHPDWEQWLSFTYSPSGCDSSTCQLVQVRMSGVMVEMDLFGIAQNFELPANAVTVTREAMTYQLAPSGVIGVGSNNLSCAVVN